MSSSKKKDYYKILEVEKEAPKSLIEEAYRELVEIYNFDSQGTYSLLEEDERNDLLESIKEAYEVLSDDLRRKQYDENVYVLSDYKNKDSEENKNRNKDFSTLNRYRAFNREDFKEKTADLFENLKVSSISGKFLKSLREKAQLSIKELSEIIKLNTLSIELLENDNFNEMPSRTYVQGHMKLYLKCFTDKYEELVKAYMVKYDESMSEKMKKN